MTDIIVEVTGAGGATNLQALTDVDTSGAANSQVLAYNATTEQWEASSVAGVDSLGALNGVDLTGNANGKYLQFDGTNFVPVDAPTGGVTSYNNLTDVPATFAPSAHTHVLADITDFSDADYATAAQGTLASTAVQPGANLSVFVNDAGFITSAPVTTVAGRTGAIVLTESDIIGLDKYTQAQVDAFLSSKANTSHTHIKSQITDFSDADYATAAQGTLASTALQNLVEDATPQLGGALDTNGNALIDAVAVNVNGEKVYTVTTSTINGTEINAIALPVALNKRITFTLQGSAIDEATGDTFGFLLSGCARNHNGTTALIGGEVLTEFKSAGATAWDIAPVGNDTNDTLEIKITGESAHNLTWDFVLRTVEV